MSNQPQSNVQAQMLKARDLIQQRQYAQARTILNSINHPKATEWLAKLDEAELGDPFAGHTKSAPISQTVDNRVAVALSKNYTNAAVVVLVLYFVLWLPGLIANAMYYEDAKRQQEIAKQELPGTGALRLEMIILGWIPLMMLLALAIIVLVIAAISYFQIGH